MRQAFRVSCEDSRLFILFFGRKNAMFNVKLGDSFTNCMVYYITVKERKFMKTERKK